MTDTTDTDQLRDRIAAMFRHAPGAERLGDATPGEIADAVLAALPTSGPCTCGGQFPISHLHADTHEPALAVARQVLGTTTGQPDAAPWPPGGDDRPDHELYTTLRKAGLDPEAAQQMIDTYTRTILARQPETEAAAPTLSALMATIQELQALQQPLVDGLRFIREDMDRAHKGGDEWATGWMGDVWLELPLRVRAAGGDTDAAQELADEAQQPTPDPAETEVTP
ncbi:hypothetical protein ACFVDT_07110 [Streptomyces sp. NPDC057699]|uniref:hypothetical protein n=1 Tax=Streptomyces sp. NPDC057699 TaxID=3346220 RepID=UPI0036CCDF92